MTLVGGLDLDFTEKNNIYRPINLVEVVEAQTYDRGRIDQHDRDYAHRIRSAWRHLKVKVWILAIALLT